MGSANEASNHARVGGLNAASGSDFAVATSVEASAQAPFDSDANTVSGCWNTSEEQTRSFLGIVLLDCRSVADDETQQLPTAHPFPRRLRPRVWMRWLTGAADRKAVQDAQDRQANDHFSVDETLHALPALLNGCKPARWRRGAGDRGLRSAEEPAARHPRRSRQARRARPVRPLGQHRRPTHRLGDGARAASATPHNYSSPATSRWRAVC